MCGINGIFAYGDSLRSIDEAELLRTRERMASRGPDGAGVWLSPDRRVGLGHRRLAIIDLSRSGAQPMSTVDGRLVITFNGEIYNYRQLRRDLEGRGYRFQSQSDTEVLLHLYSEHGPRMVEALRGMFAFAIWDCERQGMLLARDHFGVKPLYFADNCGSIRFASQVKALLAGGAVGGEADPAGYAGFLLWGFVPEPHTLYRDIRALPAGSYLWVTRSSGPITTKYFSIREEIQEAQDEFPSERNARAVLTSTVEESVRAHMVADVPVGMFLSSGLDSSLIAAHAAALAPGRFNTLTLGFTEYRGTSNDETQLAESFAREIGANHTTRWIGKESFLADFDAILDAMDQPTTDGINSYLVSKAASQAGMKVALSGLGGDELLAGYPSFVDVPRIVRLNRHLPPVPGLARAIRRVANPIFRAISSPKYAGLLEYGGDFSGAYLLRRALFMPWEIPDLDPDFVGRGLEELATLAVLTRASDGIRSDRLRVTALELEFYMRGQLLRDADWAGMANSIEIRVPFVDVPMFRQLVRLVLSGWSGTKRDAIAMSGRELPERILRRPKTGFAVPIRDWLGGSEYGREGRGQRLWARRVLKMLPRPKRYLVLTSEAYGGFGGIARYNQDLIDALCADPECGQVVAIPRLVRKPIGRLPAKLRYETSGVNDKLGFLRAVITACERVRHVDMVICGHINLLPIAWLAAKRYRVPLVLFIYGIDAWEPPRRAAPRMYLRSTDLIVAISEITKARFLSWSGVDFRRVEVLPNAVHVKEFAPRADEPDLRGRYGLDGKRIIMTLGRMVSMERYKGFDEVIEAMASMTDDENLVYLACGDGTDRKRLESKAAALGIAERTVFTGEIAENEKGAHFRLADAYVMPSWGEGFGFVLIEAVACGAPTVGSITDGGREALLDGKLGILVDPGDPADVQRGIREALARPKGVVPPAISHFAFENFCVRLRHLLASVRDHGGAEPPSKASVREARGAFSRNHAQTNFGEKVA